MLPWLLLWPPISKANNLSQKNSRQVCRIYPTNRKKAVQTGYIYIYTNVFAVILGCKKHARHIGEWLQGIEDEKHELKSLVWFESISFFFKNILIRQHIENSKTLKHGNKYIAISGQFSQGSQSRTTHHTSKKNFNIFLSSLSLPTQKIFLFLYG